MGRFFEMYAVVDGDAIVGYISLYEHSANVVSIGPEIFPEYKRREYGFSAMEKAINTAAEMGYKIVSQQVRVNNTASRRLHEKSGFETDGYVYKNRHGNEVLIYLKLLG